MIDFTAHTFKCVCHCRRVMFRVLGMYNFAAPINIGVIHASSHVRPYIPRDYLNDLRSNQNFSLALY